MYTVLIYTGELVCDNITSGKQMYILAAHDEI